MYHVPDATGVACAAACAIMRAMLRPGLSEPSGIFWDLKEEVEFAYRVARLRLSFSDICP
jgi:hypothetical protein